ncbi:MAG: TIGR00730 family Rossman fold protein [Actinomycetes bacterium]
MTHLSAVAVYCGSSMGVDERFADAASALGGLVARRQLRLVYGGGHVGLMGVVADAALAAGGAVDGVITHALEDKETAHHGLTSLRVVATMHERKAVMADASDAFIMLPGGFGTLDEFFEVVTWTQLGVHAKPCGILDVEGYFSHLERFLDHAAAEGLIRPEHRAMIIVDADPESLLNRLEGWEPTDAHRWLQPSER